MSKRFINQQQYGERKKPKLDVTISDHNFPLSQNVDTGKDCNQVDNWGDDNDDEILLLASQACEDVFNNDITVPDYSMCMQPQSTSTQNTENTEPNTSKSKYNLSRNSSFQFKKPSNLSSGTSSTNLKERCQRISSPLPGITPKVMKMSEPAHVTDDLILNENLYKGHDPEFAYKQLLKLQEENAKLKSENGKLLEKCVTKEGEASILRTQLKSCQMAVDNVRLEKIRAQEKVQMEWTEKLNGANNQVQDLRNQLDFKNLEIISVKERCKMLESSKIKLTQVTSNHDVSMSHKASKASNDLSMVNRRVKTNTCGIQTDNEIIFMKLNKSIRQEPIKLQTILPLLLQPTKDQTTILELSDKLQKPSNFIENKCKIYSTFHRIPSTPAVTYKQEKLNLCSIYEDFVNFIQKYDSGSEDNVIDIYVNIIHAIEKSLKEVSEQLEKVSQRTTTAFLKEIDEKYIEATSTYIVFDENECVSGRSLYKDEQAILARRLTMLSVQILECSRSKPFTDHILESRSIVDNHGCVFVLVCKICDLLDLTSCSILYSGLLLSIIKLLDKLWEYGDKTILHSKILELTKLLITSRPLPVISYQIMCLWQRLATFGSIFNHLCNGNTGSNLKTDYDQGVLLFKKESCTLQIALRQIESALKCLETSQCADEGSKMAGELMILQTVLFGDRIVKKHSCDCQSVMSQVIVYSLQICSTALKNSWCDSDILTQNLKSVCRAGLLVLYQWMIRDMEFGSQLGHNEGHLHLFVEHCADVTLEIVVGDVDCHMLTELQSTIQAPVDEVTLPTPLHKQVWIETFNKFTITD